MFKTASSTSPAACDLQALGQPVRVLMWGFRALVQYHRSAEIDYSEIQTLFEHFGVEEALPPLEFVLRVFAVASHTPLGLHCAGCAKLSESEASLLAAAAAAQARDIETTRTELERWILPSAADTAWKPLYEIGRIFEAADLILDAPPRRRSAVALRLVAGGKTVLH